MEMQDQQQHPFKTILDTNGPFSYCGLHLPQQPVKVSETGGGLSAKDAGSEKCIVSVEPALQTPANTTAFPASTMSSLIDYLNVSSTSKSTLSSSVSISPIASTSTSLISNNDTTSINNTVVNNVTNNLLNTSPTNIKSPCKNTETGMTSSIIGNVSSSTSKSNLDKTNDNEFQSQKSPAPPSRMVTRSQTAAERMQPSLAEGGLSKNDPLRARKHVRSSGSDLDEEYSPHKVKREMLSSSRFAFDDFAYAKSPSGAGIDFAAVCADCGVVAVTGVGWAAHQQAHRNEGAACIYCNQVFLTDQGRQIHQQLHRDGQTRDVDDFCECGICGGSFISVLYLELHLLELHGREALSDQRSVHLGPSSSSDPSCTPEDESGRQLFRCGVCRSLFTFSLNLDCHMALHSEVSYCCAVCDAAFPTLDPLVTHSKAHRFIGHVPTQAGVPVHMTASPLPPRTPQCSIFQPVTNSSFSAWKPQPVRNTYPRSALTQTTATAPGVITSPVNVQASPVTSKVAHQSAVSKASVVPPSGSTMMNTSVTQPAGPTVMPVMAPMMSSPLMTPMSQMITPTMGPAMTPVMAAPMTPAMLNYCMMMSLWGGGNKSCGNQGGIPMWQNYMNPSMANVINYFNPYLLNNHMMNNSTGTNEVNQSFQNSCCKQDNSNKEHEHETVEASAKSESCAADESANLG
ncbi:uncharacterized protein [Macrobrachium rosenbergii]|uniref:uncharacterized protein isoform X1 n=2 Tax=Macrobrachium rosenbergii TaxID=79674 RepID=UPI0034D3B51A